MKYKLRFSSGGKMSLSVVMPVYNEQDVIELVVKSIHKSIISKIKDSEFIIVNDCSTDNTLKILEKLKKKLDKLRIITPAKNGGHGKAIRLGFLKAKKDWVFHIDSDNQFDPAEYWKLDKIKDDYDLLLGYRRIRHDALHRLVITRLVRLMNLALFGTRIKDSNSPFKLIRRKVLLHLLSIVPENVFAPSIMISTLAKKLRYRMKEIEVTHFSRKTGKVSILGLKLMKVCTRGAKETIQLRKKTLLLSKEEYRKAKEIMSSA